LQLVANSLQPFFQASILTGFLSLFLISFSIFIADALQNNNIFMLLSFYPYQHRIKGPAGHYPAQTKVWP
jgi:hypothetical protein